MGYFFLKCAAEVIAQSASVVYHAGSSANGSGIMDLTGKTGLGCSCTGCGGSDSALCFPFPSPFCSCTEP